LEPVLQQLLQRYPNDVKLVILHFPLEGHEFSMMAAKAALAANMQGKFWEFHEDLFEHSQDLSDALIRDIANSLGLDMERFEKDRNSVAVSNLIQKNLMTGGEIGINGTPIVFINGKLVRRLGLADMSEMIAEALKKGN